MSERSSVFSTEWRKCLAEHYKYIVREGDRNTEETLVPRLLAVGFREDDLRQLYREATMRAEDLPEDFLPDPAKALAPDDSAAAAPETTFQTHPAECGCPSCMDLVLEEGHDDEGQPLPMPDPEEALPKQKKLF